MHSDDLLDSFSIFARVRFLIERQRDKDAVRSMIRSSKNRFTMVVRGGVCLGENGF